MADSEARVTSVTSTAVGDAAITVTVISSRVAYGIPFVATATATGTWSEEGAEDMEDATANASLEAVCLAMTQVNALADGYHPFGAPDETEAAARG